MGDNFNYEDIVSSILESSPNIKPIGQFNTSTTNSEINPSESVPSFNYEDMVNSILNTRDLKPKSGVDTSSTVSQKTTNEISPFEEAFLKPITKEEAIGTVKAIVSPLVPMRPKAEEELYNQQHGILKSETYKSIGKGFLEPSIWASTWSQAPKEVFNEIIEMSTTPVNWIIPGVVKAGGSVLKQALSKVAPNLLKFVTEKQIPNKVVDKVVDFIITKKPTNVNDINNGINSEVYNSVARDYHITQNKINTEYSPNTGKIINDVTPMQSGMLREIGDLKPLEVVNKDALNWVPPSVKNPYSDFAYNQIYSKLKNAKQVLPSDTRFASTDEIGNLTKERARIWSGLSNKITEDYIKPLNKIPSSEQSRVALSLMGEMPLSRDLSPKTSKLIKDTSVFISKMGEGMVNFKEKWQKEGYDVIGLDRETWMKNLGNYTRSTYIKPEGAFEPTLVPGAFNKKNILNNSMFKKKLTNEEWGNYALKNMGKTPKEIAEYPLADKEILGLNKKLDYGLLTQADKVVDITAKSMANNYATMAWQDSVIHTPTLFSKTPKDGFIKVSDLLPRGVESDARLGVLNQGYINPALSDEIKLFSSGEVVPNTIGKELIGWWKATRVPMNVPTVVRNFLSGSVVQNDFAGYPIYNPKNSVLWKDMMMQYMKKGDRYTFWRDRGLFGSNYFDVEINPQTIKYINNSENPISAYAKVFEDRIVNTSKKDEFVKAVKGVIVDGIPKANAKAKDLVSYYGHIDNLQRQYLAESALRDGATPAQAIQFSNKWQLDYRFVPKWIDKIRNSKFGAATLPFISFYSMMAPRTMEVAITRPWVILKYPIILGLVGAYSQNKLGLTEQQIENSKPAVSSKNSYVVPLPDELGSNKGRVNYLDLSYTLPFGSPKTGYFDYDQIGKTIAGEGVMGSLTGLYNNYDNLSGAKIYGEDDIPSIKEEKINNYIKRNFAPGTFTHVKNIYKAVIGEKQGYPEVVEKSIPQSLMRLGGVTVASGGVNDVMSKVANIEKSIANYEKQIESIVKNHGIYEKYDKKEMFSKLQEVRTSLVDKLKELENFKGEASRFNYEDMKKSREEIAKTNDNIRNLIKYTIGKK